MKRPIPKLEQYTLFFEHIPQDISTPDKKQSFSKRKLRRPQVDSKRVQQPKNILDNLSDQEEK